MTATKKLRTPYVALYARDFESDVTTLTAVELGVYWRILLRYYADMRPVRADDIERIFPEPVAVLAMDDRAARTLAEWNACHTVLARFFNLRDGCWHNKRADAEIARAQGVYAAQCDRAATGRKALESKRSSSVSPKASPNSSLPLEGELRTKNKDNTYSPLFLSFWGTYPHTQGRSSKANSAKRWASLGCDSMGERVTLALHDAIASKAFSTGYWPASEVWLAKRMWENVIPGSVAKTQQGGWACPPGADPRDWKAMQDAIAERNAQVVAQMKQSGNLRVDG